ncbi:piwi-like protein 1 [Saccostrea echinata]|uniref:piwi-like protein 1 n=1 Tax=Saccostrea echinata TaxID=191078 RepID=UPI002A8280AF|nr:piwi-like protein 1 [Saccostrea echinata]
MTGRGRARARGRARRLDGDEIRRPGEHSSEAQKPPVQVVRETPPRTEQIVGGAQAGPEQIVRGSQAGAEQTVRGSPAQPEDVRRGIGNLQIQRLVGHTGQPIQLMTNYFSLSESKNWIYYQYHIDFSPPLDSTRMKKKVFYQLPQFRKKTTIFDGGILYLPYRMPDKVTEITVGSPVDNSPIRVTIKETREMSWSDPETEKLYCVLLGRILENLLGMTFIGRNYYDMSPELVKKYPEHHLSIYPGYVTSIANYEHGMLLCADISHKILRDDTMWTLFQEVYTLASSEEDQKIQIRANYFFFFINRYNNRTYKIADVDFSKHPTDSFPRADGTSMTYIDYYKQHYDIDLTDIREQPLILHRVPRRERRPGRPEFVYLIPQLCFLTGLTAQQCSDYHVMRDIAETTRVEPFDRAASLQEFVKRINSNPQFQREMDGLSFYSDMMTIKGRVLGRENIKVRDSRRMEVDLNFKMDEAAWGRQMHNMYLPLPVKLVNWVLLCPSQCSKVMGNFIGQLQDVAARMGIQTDFPVMPQMTNDSIGNYDKVLKQTVNPSTQLVMCILPNYQKSRYDHIKTLCCVTHPVPSQCVVKRTISNPKTLKSVATKIAIQINCKLGGFPWEVGNPLSRHAVMLVGIDTYHDSKTRNLSYAGVVCSTNPGFNCYYSKTLAQHPGEELLNGITVCIIAAMKKYHERNGYFPKRVIVYRDGVGDGQIQAVLEHEKPQFLAAFDRLNLMQPDDRPKISIIIVKKRINTRFFLRGSNENPYPGTIVDTDVTKPRPNVKYDFFCVSQSVRQGTVTPTHYNVVEDENAVFLTPDRMQQLAYKLTHLYYNWPGTIRVPAPCQYAHKLAYLTGQSLHRDPSELLSDCLFFL